MRCARSGNTIVAYSYDAPWLCRTGDHVRINAVLQNISELLAGRIILYCLSENVNETRSGNITYVEFPRLLYAKIARKLESLFKLIDHEIGTIDFCKKLLQIFVDEPLLVLKTLRVYPRIKTIIVHGSMSVVPFWLRLLGFRYLVIYDTLGNHAQTLHLQTKRSQGLSRILNLLKLGFYCILHNLQLASSDVIIYPSNYDAFNAARMFKVYSKKVILIPNPFPIAYRNREEYLQLREEYRANLGATHEDAILIFAGGGRNETNEEALRAITELKSINQNKVLMIVTGPWLDYKLKFNKLNSIFTGEVSIKDFTGLLAAADIGLAPMFTSSGTSIKVLGYLAAGLSVVATPIALCGIPCDMFKKLKCRVYLATDGDTFVKAIYQAVDDVRFSGRPQNIVTEEYAQRLLSGQIMKFVHVTRECQAME